MTKIVYLLNDPDAANPCSTDRGDGNWILHRFESGYTTYRDPDTFVYEEDEETGERKVRTDMAEKLKAGLAFWLRCHKHGTESWSLGSDDRPDGILVWEEPAENLGATTYEERKASAASAVDEFDKWCNGGVYGFRVVESCKCHCGNVHDGEEIDSCYGMYEWKDMLDEIKGNVGDDEVILKGEASWLANKGDFKLVE